MPRTSLLLPFFALACGSDPVGETATSAITSTTADTPTTASSEPVTSTTSSDGSDSDSATTGPASTTADTTTTAETSTTETSTTAETSTAETSTTASLDPCDPDPCVAPQHCEDGACFDPPQPGAGQVIVVEMMIDPAPLSDYDAEWFELSNVSDEHLDLEGCRLADLGVNDNDLEISSGGPLVLAPGALMVMAKTADPALNGGITGVAYAFGQDFSLTNTGDAFVLRCADVDIDIVEYAPMTWPYAVGVGMQLDPSAHDAGANDVPTAWCAATAEYTPGNTGSPGLANPPCR